MFLLYNKVAQSIANTLAGYNAGAWGFFRDGVANELSSLVESMPGGSKNITLLKKSMPYINRSTDWVNNAKSFSYYDSENGIHNKKTDKPILADPSNDTGNKIKDKVRPTLNEDVGYLNVSGVPQLSVYDEGTKVGFDKVVSDNEYTSYTAVDDRIDPKSLLSRTSKWFKRAENDYIARRFKTIHSRFHTEPNNVSEMESDISNPAFSKTYGLSHGRNLLKLKPDQSENYDNPYCRVWTWHHQYQRVISDSIRPFRNNSGEPATLEDLDKENGWDAFRASAEGGFKNGSSRLSEYGAMYDDNGKTNGFVNITPKYSGKTGQQSVGLKHCMFSIENLAWKGMFNDYDEGIESYGLSSDQKGPLGGRIMWFPPYGLTFQETSTARWDENTFIGRGEPMYTYSNTTRTGSLSFKLLIDHPAILDYWDRKYETGTKEESNVDDVDSKEQEMLRFFAGCERLDATDADLPTSSAVEETVPDEEQPQVQSGNIIQFLVFYPNNYSGMDDKIDGKVDPIKYLVNGVGTQKKYVSGTKNGIQDLQTDVSQNFVWNGKTVGGYEMRDVGISLVTDFTKTNAITELSSSIDSNDKVTLMKMFDSKYVSSAAQAPDDEKGAEEWHKNRYYYRADKNTLGQVLLGKNDSYIDNRSYKLNSTGYQDAVSYYTLKDPTYSLTEMFVAIEGDNSNVLSGLYDKEHVAVIKSVLAGDKGKITKVVCSGMASKDSNSQRSHENQSSLARNRAKTVKDWLEKKLGVKCEIGKLEVSTKQSESGQNANDKVDKLTRMALVEIHYGTDETSDASETQVAIDENGNVESNTSTMTNTPSGSTEDLTIGRVHKEVAVKKRYDYETRFFKQLQENDPYMTELLSERVKYFNPAFHSMSPEGFNARLTFLNQCMRQGPTISGSDTQNENANNLSFGRPPVCVLRVGDFYNTKVIITSLSIEYDPLTWDLNQEGIGVMPMIANVTMQMNFIGGSDLGGPIQRLQNALSFNYYANASVYDNRAENIEYEKDGFGSVKNFKAFTGQHF